MMTEHMKDAVLTRRHAVRGSRWVWLALVCVGAGCGPSRTMNEARRRDIEVSTERVAPIHDEAQALGDFPVPSEETRLAYRKGPGDVRVITRRP